MKGKKEIIIGFIVTSMVFLTLFFYLMGAGEIGLDEIILVGIVIILVSLAMYIIWDKIRNIQRGLPIKDERVINISYKAGYYGFIAAVWSAVLCPVIIDIIFRYELNGGDVTAIVVLISAFVFILSYLYLYYKGK
jgi:hypothetical protein